MIHPTLQAAKAECTEKQDQGRWAAVYQRVVDRQYFCIWAMNRRTLVNCQQLHNAYIVALLYNGDWIAADHFMNLIGQHAQVAEEVFENAPTETNRQISDALFALSMRSPFNLGLDEAGGANWGMAPEDAPYEYSLELEALFKLLSSEHMPDRVNALLVLSSWDLKLLPADMHKALEYLARNDSHTVVRQWAEFVLDPLNKPIPPRQGV